ncbi:MAG: hypothetical protein HRT44_01965, partial [Bdellovibrionales bacterium]|nr:hypothetical protein [Bdellovibrionales bacterium]NQZ18013.1 hypothetical protein [Bdellovibrionales bacterium]
MILLLISSFLWAQDYCANKDWVSKDYAALEKSIDQKIQKSSHLVPIAKEADGILSKLIKAKSPILMNWLDKRKLFNEKEEKIASEWRKYYLENFILSKYPTPNNKINASVEELFAQINKISFSDADKEKFEKVFTEAQKQSVKVVLSWKLAEKTEKEIVEKLNGMKLYWFDKLKGGKYQNIPLEFVRWGVAYDPVKNEINIGVQAKKYASDSTLFSVFVHEMGHSMDPCRWSAFFKEANPFSELYKCLRQKESA